MSLNINFKTDGLRITQAEVEGFMPHLTLFQGSNKLAVKGISLSAIFILLEERNELNLFLLVVGLKM